MTNKLYRWLFLPLSMLLLLALMGCPTGDDVKMAPARRSTS